MCLHNRVTAGLLLHTPLIDKQGPLITCESANSMATSYERVSLCFPTWKWLTHCCITSSHCHAMVMVCPWCVRQGQRLDWWGAGQVAVGLVWSAVGVMQRSCPKGHASSMPPPPGASAPTWKRILLTQFDLWIFPTKLKEIRVVVTQQIKVRCT